MKIPQYKGLIFKAVTSSDLDSICEMNSEAEVIRYIRDGKVLSREEEREALDKRIDYARENPSYGFWSVSTEEDDSILAYANLNHIYDDGPNHGKVHLGYKISLKEWRKGYGKKIALAMLDQAVRNTQLETLYAFVDPANEVSIHILQKIGFDQKDERTSIYGYESIKFKIDLKSLRI